MSVFQLDPESIAARVRASGETARIPSLAASVAHGAVGFMIVSVAGFVPWAVFGRPLHRAIGEVGMYLVCAIVFLGLSGPILHRLILGPGSLPRFFKLFTIAFTAYSFAWIGGWMALRGDTGSLAGLFAGTALMGAILARAFDAGRATVAVIAALFLLNTVGYFIGGWCEGAIMGDRALTLFGLSRRGTRTSAMLLWGVGYGLGLGAGLGVAFHFCQAKARALLNQP